MIYAKLFVHMNIQMGIGHANVCILKYTADITVDGVQRCPVVVSRAPNLKNVADSAFVVGGNSSVGDGLL